jgi:hypothetical protein
LNAMTTVGDAALLNGLAYGATINTDGTYKQ